MTPGEARERLTSIAGHRDHTLSSNLLIVCLLVVAHGAGTFSRDEVVQAP